MNAVETIAEKLRYFTELDSLSQVRSKGSFFFFSVNNHYLTMTVSSLFSISS